MGTALSDIVSTSLATTNGVSVLLGIPGTATTTTTLASSANPSAFGGYINLTATVSPSTATGSITFKDGTTTLGTATLGNGSASFYFNTLIAGTHSLTAVYNGDTHDATSTSAVLTETVTVAATAVTLRSSPDPQVLGQNVTFIASVAPSLATGTITFKDGSTTLTSVNLSSGGNRKHHRFRSCGGNAFDHRDVRRRRERFGCHLVGSDPDH